MNSPPQVTSPMSLRPTISGHRRAVLVPGIRRAHSTGASAAMVFFPSGRMAFYPIMLFRDGQLHRKILCLSSTGRICDCRRCWRSLLLSSLELGMRCGAIDNHKKRTRPLCAGNGESSAIVGEKYDVTEETQLGQIKVDLYQALDGINRGIFGVPSAKKSEIENLVKLLESQNPNPDPMYNLTKVGGCWKLVYSTITILGSKRTKLGLRDFINLGDFFQIVDVAEGKATNVIKFSARGLNMLNGQLTIQASFKVASGSRVDITYEKSTITPDQLMNIFRQNYDLLLGIFNPEGWLEITYVDNDMRIGRDDKGNLYILERSEET